MCVFECVFFFCESLLRKCTALPLHLLEFSDEKACIALDDFWAEEGLLISLFARLAGDGPTGLRLLCRIASRTARPCLRTCSQLVLEQILALSTPCTKLPAQGAGE